MRNVIEHRLREVAALLFVVINGDALFALFKCKFKVNSAQRNTCAQCINDNSIREVSLAHCINGTQSFGDVAKTKFLR
ncbi:hypothetical protein BH10BAC6_BH10BAC6_11900 [soil metagenome]